jgi:hypothetical protein
MGSLPLVCYLGAKTVHAVVGTSLAVDPAYRGHSIRLMTCFFRQSGPDVLLLTTASEGASTISQRLFAMQPIPQPEFNESLFWIINFPAVARVYLERGASASKRWVRTATLRLACRAALPLLLWCDTSIRRRTPGRGTARGNVRSLKPNQVDVAFDDLWNRKTAQDQRFMADRRSPALRWRFGAPDHPGSPRFLCYYEGERLDGYAVLERASGSSGLARSVITDLFVANDAPMVTAALLRAAYLEARRNGSQVLESPGFPASIRLALRRANPHQRALAAAGPGPYLYRANRPELASVLASSESWYACPSDGDAGM